MYDVGLRDQVSTSLVVGGGCAVRFNVAFGSLFYMIDELTLGRLVGLPIEGVAERLGMRVKRHLTLCPFHDDHRASLHFNRNNNNYRCFVCGAHGRNIDLVMNSLGVSFLDACRWLDNGTSGILTEYQAKVKKEPKAPPPVDLDALLPLVAEPVLTEEARHFLFEVRKLDPRVIRWCGISSNSENLLIPYYTMERKLIGLQARYLGKTPGHPRFRFPKGARCSFYNLPVLKRLQVGEPLYLAEGASDCWSLLSSGHKSIAIPSATLLKEADLKWLRDFGLEHETVFHMYPDQDDAGESLFCRLQEQIPQLVRHELPEGCKDFSDFYCRRQEKSNVKC